MTQKIDRQQGFAARFLIHDDLREHIMRDVLAAFGIDDAKIAAVAHHRAQIVERDIAAAFSVVEAPGRSEEHTSELQSLMRISYAVFCLKKKKIHKSTTNRHIQEPTYISIINQYDLTQHSTHTRQ